MSKFAFHDFVQYNEGTDHLQDINIDRQRVEAGFYIFEAKYNVELCEVRKSWKVEEYLLLSWV